MLKRLLCLLLALMLLPLSAALGEDDGLSALTLEELTGDLNNYCDQVHYGAWVNDWMLRQMALDAGRLTEENVDDYLSRERARWENFDFNALFEQEDPPEDPTPAFFRQ